MELYINKVSRDGGTVTLIDGSVWQVHELDSYKSSLWLPIATKIRVCENSNGLFGYKHELEKISSGQRVRAKRI